MRSPSSQKNPNRGFSLVEILVALGIMAGLMLGIVTLVENTNKSSMATRLSLTRDRLTNLVTLYVSRTAALKNSLTHANNSYFERCVNSNIAGTTDCTAGTTYALTLLEPVGTNIFAGTTAAPSRYDANGAPCAAVSNGCPLEVITSFVAVCPGATAVCDQAQSLQVTYLVRKSPALTSPPTWIGTIADRTATITKTSAEILGAATSCPTGKCVIGIYPDGSVQCEP